MWDHTSHRIQSSLDHILPFLRFSQTVTEPFNSVCMLHTHALLMYIMTHCLEEQAVCVSENVFLIKWVPCVLETFSTNPAIKKSRHIEF